MDTTARPKGVRYSEVPLYSECGLARFLAQRPSQIGPIPGSTHT